MTEKLPIPTSLPQIRKGADKFLAFPISLFAAQPKEFYLDGLKKSEQQSHTLRGDMWGKYIFFNPVACYFLYEAKDLSAPIVFLVYCLSPYAQITYAQCRRL
jgi:hypothetical protein